MFTVQKKIGVLIILVTIALIAIGVNFTFGQSRKNRETPPAFSTSFNMNIDNKPASTRPAGCVPLPSLKNMNSANLTATPTFASIDSSKTAMAVPPINIDSQPESIINLSPNLAIQDEAQIRVFRCDGKIDVYFIDPNVDFNKLVLLKDGDTVISSVPPASMMGHIPPPFNPSSTKKSPTPSNSTPYPAPGTPVINKNIITPTTFQYP